ncbi:MAG: peptide chain release factor N(5)-glutamine methyltransferase [bacterium]|nr:peptide chain release factor N(5)-glutamine methyltransferase [bacterium]
MLSIQQSLIWASQQLKKSNIKSHGLDAEVLLSFILKTTKEKLYAHPEQKLNGSQLTTYNKLIKRRAKHEPVAYLTGHKEFFGLDFWGNKKVLIPRPETELMIDQVLYLFQKSVSKRDGRSKLTPIIVDVGTGSGCIVITLAKIIKNWKLEIGNWKFFGSDISPAALKLARLNARRHGVEKQIKFLRGNLLEPVAGFPIPKALGIGNPATLIITANLPYLPTAEWQKTMPDVKNYEPRLALDGGPDGLKYYRQLFTQLKKLYTINYSLLTTHYLLIEICPHQANAITKLARHFFPKARVQIKKDLGGHKRVAIIKA